MMASRGLFRLYPKPSVFSSRAIRPQRSLLTLSLPKPPPPILETKQRTTPTVHARLFSHSSLRRSWQQRQKPPSQGQPPTQYEYDPKLGDPWYHHRLRTAKPLFEPDPNTPKKYPWLRLPRSRTIIVASFAAALFFYWWNLEVVPVSGRRRFNCYTDATVDGLAEMQYKRLLYDMERQGGRFLPDSDARTRMVKRVMARLVPVSGMADSGWEVHVIANDDPRAANAFVLPGGKVFVYSGMLRLARTDAQLAAVLSHEIAHNLARHIPERLSQSVGETFFLGSTLMLLAASPFTFVAGWLFGGELLDLLFSLPMSRMQESEADFIGVMMMAEACYDPREAVVFWERMDQVHRHMGTEPPEFMSTHPSNQHRIERIRGWLPRAMEKREESDCHGAQGFADMFRRAMERGDVMSGRM